MSMNDIFGNIYFMIPGTCMGTGNISDNPPSRLIIWKTTTNIVIYSQKKIWKNSSSSGKISIKLFDTKKEMSPMK